jgi:hypothetical protein
MVYALCAKSSFPRELVRRRNRVMPESLDKSWTIEEDAFPAEGEPQEKLRFLMHYAMLAPSRYNTQPWLFWAQGDTVGLCADRTRALPIVDPENRELTMSCGAALFHLRVALGRFGYAYSVEPFPNRWNPDLLALVRLGAMRDPTEEEAALFHTMFVRRTNRMLFEEREVPEGILSALETAASKEGARLYLVKDKGTREKVAQLIYEGSRLQWADEHFRRELADWVRPNRTDSRDGMPGGAVGFGELMSMMWPAFASAFEPGHNRAAKDRLLATEAPVLAVLATEDNTRAEWLLAGQALSRVLLRAGAEGMSASFLSQPIEVRALRSRLIDALGAAGHPQLIFRMGYAPEVRPTPRRSATELTIGR